MEDLAPFIVIWLVSGLITAMVWSSKGGSSGAAFLMGVLFGPLAVLVAFFTSPSSSAGGSGGGRSGGRSGGLPRRSCPHCREPMAVDARVCPNCQRESEPIPVNASAQPHQVRGEIIYAELARFGAQSPRQLSAGTGMAPRDVQQALRGLARSGVLDDRGDGTYAVRDEPLPTPHDPNLPPDA